MGCKSADEFVLLAYLDEMVRCVRKPRSLLRAGIRFRRAALGASKRIVKKLEMLDVRCGGRAGAPIWLSQRAEEFESNC